MSLVITQPGLILRHTVSTKTVKYFLKARNKITVEMFKRKNILHEPVDKELCIKMKKSASEYESSIDISIVAAMKQLLMRIYELLIDGNLSDFLDSHASIQSGFNLDILSNLHYTYISNLILIYNFY